MTNQPDRKRPSLQDMEVQIRRSLIEVQTRMDQMVDSLPLNDNDESNPLSEDQLSDQDVQTIVNLQSIEQEWILDPKVRAEFSAIGFIDDDEDTDSDGDWQWGDSDPDTGDASDW